MLLLLFFWLLFLRNGCLSNYRSSVALLLSNDLEEGNNAISIAGPLVLGGLDSTVAFEDLESWKPSNVKLFGEAAFHGGIHSAESNGLAHRGVALEGSRRLYTHENEARGARARRPLRGAFHSFATFYEHARKRNSR